VQGDGLTVQYLCNRFLTGKRHLLDNGELKSRTFAEYYRRCEKIIAGFGKNRLITDLAADDLDRLRAELAKGRGPVSLRYDVRHIRMVFEYAFDAGLTDKPVRYGPNFKGPAKRILRQTRQVIGKRMFEADEIRRIVNDVRQPLKAMVLLAINCGFGQTDCAILARSAVDLDNGFVDFPRPKTGVERRRSLWSETVKALREAIHQRPKPQTAADDNLCFLTRHGRWSVRTGSDDKPAEQHCWIDSVVREFTKVLIRLILKRPGLNFYAIRHTFETIGGESKDRVAVNAIMGHVDNSMAEVYRERISDERLKAVVDVVHEWLFDSTH
jgi:integrase